MMIRIMVSVVVGLCVGLFLVFSWMRLPLLQQQEQQGQLQHQQSCSSSKQWRDRQRDHSNCPSEVWYALMAEHYDPPYHFVNIGLNKGFALELLYELWAPALNLTQEKWRQALSPEGNVPYGPCGKEASFPPPAVPYAARHNVIPKSIGVEPLMTNVNLMLHAVDVLHLNDSIQVIHAGVSDKEEIMYANDLAECAMPGAEACSLTTERQNHNTIPVRVLTLDSLVAEYLPDADKIDVLYIDTEGNDFYVLLGGLGLLGNQRIRFLTFEYHSVPRWTLWNLATPITLLDGYGYECYYAGQARVWRLTNCMDVHFETKQWSNVVCVLRKDPWFPILERLEACHMDPGFCNRS